MENMKYNEAIQYITDLCRFGINLGLDRTKKLLSLAGSPDKQFYIVHVAGTNGKGSTSVMMKEALRSSGLKTGLYTSPHLHSYRERIQINGELISEERFGEETEKLKKIIEKNSDLFPESPTEFEFLTILAARYFYEEKVDAAVFETGLGGRLDSTNALETDLSIITNIGMDHKEILGKTIEEIAREKAGIIRCGGKTIIGIQEYKEAEEVLNYIADKEEARKKTVKDIKYSIQNEIDNFQIVYLNHLNKEISLNLQGSHQVENMLNVVAALDFLKEDFKINEDDYFQGFKTVKWPGRLELLKFHGREILLDGAHNPQGAGKLREYLESRYKSRKIYYLLGILDDKDKKGILDEVGAMAEKIVISRPEGSRTEKWDILPFPYNEKKDIIFVENTEDALIELTKEIEEEDLILCFGSFYFISKIREIINLA